MLQDHPLKILVLSTFDGRTANVIRDFLFSFNGYSIHDYYYIFDCRILDKHTDFSAFDVVLVFWSLYLPGSELSEGTRDKIRQSRALKVLFLQDEYRDVRLLNQLMNQLGVQVMFTCVAERDHEVFYPQRLIPSLQATYTVLTGYVPTYLEKHAFDSQYDRRLDIAYRSRVVPYYLGDLGQEKRIIAERFQDIAIEYGFKSDISIREQDRIYGKKWVNFLKSSRIVLGCPSGASVVDFTGEIRRNCEAYLAAHPDATYQEVKQRFFAEVDWKVVIDTVSPRIFESVALGCTMVMHEGEYGGILQSGKHYIPIKKDYSNISDVIAQMQDTKYCKEIAQNAYRDLIISGTYSYGTFVKRFDSILDRHLNRFYRSEHVPSKPLFYFHNFLHYGEAIFPHKDHFHSFPFVFLVRGWCEVKIKIKNVIFAISISEFRRALLSSLMIKKHVKPKEILIELVRLNILYLLRNRKLQAPVRIHTQFDPNTCKLKFISYPSKSAVLDNDSAMHPTVLLKSLLKATMEKMPLANVEWDNSLLGRYLEYEDKSEIRVIDMGEDGVYKFKALCALSRFYPDLVIDALALVASKV